MTEFRADTYHNEYLPAGATTIDAIVSVTAMGTGGTHASSTEEPWPACWRQLTVPASIPIRGYATS